MILSAPSYVIPGTYLENLRFLEQFPEIRNVELLFFSWDEETKSLLKKELPGIRELARRFSFTAHMPSSLGRDALGIPETCEDLITNFILHPPVPAQSTPDWLETLETLRMRFGDRFLLENTGLRHFAEIRTLLPDLPVCMDTGHLLLEKNDPASFAAEHGGTIRQVHLHGTMHGRDHCSFEAADAWYRKLSPFLSEFDGIVELEIFNWDILAPLLPLMKNLRPR